MMEKLWTPGRIGPMETKNRTIRSATNEHLATRQGELTPAWRNETVKLALGGVGTIITGQFAMDATQRADEGQPMLVEGMDPGMFARSCDILRSTCEQVHEQGAKLVVQLSHTGPKALEAVNGRPPKFAADFSREELAALVKAFAFGAQVCKDCGADGVQIHMAHGYFLSSVLSPELNARTDEYGGSLENRFRLCGEIIRAVGAVCAGQMALMVKVDSNCCGDLAALLKLCQDEGVDCAEVSGLDFAAHKWEGEPFYLREVVRAGQGLDMPIALVGGVKSLEDARAVMDAGIDFVSFSRALLCESDLINKMQSGAQTRGRCLSCNNCFKIFRQRPRRCVLHTEDIPHLETVFGPYGEK